MGNINNQSGTLEATGSITDLEKEYLEEKLNGSEELVSAIKDFKSNYLKYIVPESRYGRYDVTNDNFADVFDFREMLESSRSNDDFKRTWEYETNWLKLTDNILSQLNAALRDISYLKGLFGIVIGPHSDHFKCHIRLALTIKFGTETYLTIKP